MSVGRNEMPSVSEAAAVPVISSSVGVKSWKLLTWSLVVPDFTFAGQRTIIGTRIPPSKTSTFRPRRLLAESKNFESDPPLNVGPLSLVKMKMVFSDSPNDSMRSIS